MLFSTIFSKRMISVAFLVCYCERLDINVICKKCSVRKYSVHGGHYNGLIKRRMVITATCYDLFINYEFLLVEL